VADLLLLLQQTLFDGFVLFPIPMILQRFLSNLLLVATVVASLLLNLHCLDDQLSLQLRMALNQGLENVVSASLYHMG
jgi:hypothetical protein